MTDTRTYIRLHDGMPDHPKIDGLSDRAFRLLIETWCWCSRHLTDGRIPATTWRKRGTPASRQEIIDAGLAEVGPDGAVLMHDYLEHQRSADEVAALREARREAGRKGGKAKAKALASAKQVLRQTPSKAVPSTETETEVGSNEPTRRDDVERICSHLADRIEANGSKRPVVSGKWRDAARLMIDRDGRTEDAIHRAIDWCQDSDFWRGNILSLPKFREKYDQLRLQALREQHEEPAPARHLTSVHDLEQPPAGLTDEEYLAWDHERRQRRGQR